MALSQEQALQILQSRSLITEAGKYTVKTTSTTPIIRDNGQTVTIVNFSAMTTYHAQKAIEAYNEGKYDDCTNGTSLSASQLEGQFVPSKGETVDIEVGEHVNKDGVTILVVTSIVQRKAVQAKKFSLEGLMAKAEVPAQAEPEIA